MPSEVGTTREGLLTTIWVFTSIALILFIFRIIIRKAVQKNFYWDDGFATLAMASLLISSILYTILTPYTYQELAIISGEAPQPSPGQLVDLFITQKKLLLPLQFFFWTGLVAVKFSFMFLYKLLLCHSRPMKTFWYIISVYLILTWIVLLVVVFGQCGSAKDLYNIEACNSPKWVNFITAYIWVELALVVSSDIMILVFPLPVLWSLRLPLRSKVALTPVFCLGLICIAFDILRCVEQYKGNQSLGLLWTSLELEVAVIVCMLPMFRFLISDTDKSKLYRLRLMSILTLRSAATNASKSDIALEQRSARTPKRTQVDSESEQS